jgi:DNA invertase Pin-like site-specific DNA recombinase
MRAALYARVSTPASSKRSTRDGDRERQDPEVQLIKLRAYAQARGWQVVDEYVDRRSGANPDRPALKRLETDIDAGKVDAVLVVRLDRIMRSTANFVQFLTMLEEDASGRPRRKPVALIATDQNLDTSTPAGRLMRTIIMAVAEYERDIIRERINDGLDKARADGKQLGRRRRHVDLDAFREALKVTGSQREAARVIGVPLSTIRDRLKEEEAQNV